MSRLFGTDGVRGRANLNLTPELAFKVGRAHAYQIIQNPQLQRGGRPQVVVGRDTRLSGQLLQYGYTCGLMSLGVQPLVLGVIPTPGVAWSIRRYGAQGGCVISASHNPYYDNGLKLVGADGYKLTDAQEDQLERLVAESKDLPRAVDENLATCQDLTSAQGEYGAYVRSLAKTRLEGLKIVLDCANGAASALAEPIFSSLGAQVTLLHASPDGININAQCGSTHPQTMQAKVVELGADLGLAFDGDADRCLACDERGEMIDGDHMLLLFAKWLQKDGLLPQNRLVTTVMANLGLEEACARHGLDMVRTAVGDRYVLEEMRRSGATLGGEQSGHIIFLNYSTTGDGLVTGLVLSQILKERQAPLSQLAAAVEKKPQYMVNVRVRDKYTWSEPQPVAEAVAQVEESLRGRGRLLVRPSGTENVVRVMAEGPDAQELRQLVDSIAAALELHYAPEA